MQAQNTPHVIDFLKYQKEGKTLNLLCSRLWSSRIVYLNAKSPMAYSDIQIDEIWSQRSREKVEERPKRSLERMWFYKMNFY